MTYNFDYRIGRANRTFYSHCQCPEEARAKFDQWRAGQPKKAHLMRCWAV